MAPDRGLPEPIYRDFGHEASSWPMALKPGCELGEEFLNNRCGQLWSTGRSSAGSHLVSIERHLRSLEAGRSVSPSRLAVQADDDVAAELPGEKPVEGRWYAPGLLYGN